MKYHFLCSWLGHNEYTTNQKNNGGSEISSISTTFSKSGSKFFKNSHSLIYNMPIMPNVLLAHSSRVYYRNYNTSHELAQWVSDMSRVAKMSAGLATSKKSKKSRVSEANEWFLSDTHCANSWLVL